MNYARTAMLLAAMTALFLGVGFMLGGEGGMLIALLLAGGMNLFAYWNADKMVLRMYGAHEIGPDDAPEFYGLVADLAHRGGLPMPKVYVIDNDQPNAFATGRNPENAAVAATTGLLNMLTREEVAGVMAHELAHVKHRDTLIMTITATIAGALGMLANFASMSMLFGGNRDSNGNSNPLGIIGLLVGVIVAPLAASLVQFAISRSREYEADRMGAELVGEPMWLASALEKIHYGVQRVENHDAERNPATAHLFIMNPLHGQRMDNLFSTHPSTENRVARLRELAASMGRGGMGQGGMSFSAPKAGPAARPGRRGPWG